MSSEPLVSAIMPTLPERTVFRQQAIDCFESQTWPNKELVMLDEAGTVGAKRNRCISLSRGEIIMHWDDDDWSAPGRMADQVNRLIVMDAEITGYHTMLFEDEQGRRWRYHSATPFYALGTSLCYRKRFWRHRPFVCISQGEDNAFIQGVRVLSVDAGELMIARIHGGNTCRKAVEKSSKQWVLLG